MTLISYVITKIYNYQSRTQFIRFFNGCVYILRGCCKSKEDIVKSAIEFKFDGHKMVKLVAKLAVILYLLIGYIKQAVAIKFITLFDTN